MLTGPAMHSLLVGGGRSGKTLLLMRATILRAAASPGSRHAVLRYRFNAVKQAIVLDTLPKLCRLAFPALSININRTDWYAELSNGSQIWFGGLDDKERTEKILGTEFATIYFNECSQIPYNSIGLAITRLAQRCTRADGSPLPLRAYYDANPPNKSHWLYKQFIRLQNPDTGNPLDASNYQWARINPADNTDNIAPEYIHALKGMSERMQKRFLLGEFADDNPDALFKQSWIDDGRVDVPPRMVRVVIGVDPSGAGDADNTANDAIGILVVGLGVDGVAYVMEDCTLKAGPATWGRIAVEAFDRHEADVIVAEKNYGGAMVEFVLRTARRHIPYKSVTATRGKAVRAEPFSALYEQGKIKHLGQHPELEDEMGGMTIYGYVGQGSPNRVDALIWCLAELFPGILRGAEEEKKLKPSPKPGTIDWVYRNSREEPKKSKYTS